MSDKIEIVRWTPRKTGIIIGFADVKMIKWGFIIHGVVAFEKDGNKWCSMPSNEVVDSRSGETRRYANCRFEDASQMDAFSKEFFKALDKHENKDTAAPLLDDEDLAF